MSLPSGKPMANALTQTQINDTLALSDEQRVQYLIKEVVSNKEIWILMDEHGCVMLNTDEEDCVPVWPNQEFANAWATGEWKHCQPEAISINKWLSRWTVGLEDDELALVVFPSENEQGIVYSPDELAFELNKRMNKGRK